MKCKCGYTMTFIDRFDTGLCENAYCYNVYTCTDCGNLAKENVWENKGTLWVTLINEVIVEYK